MKILQVGKYYFPYRGGIESVVQSLCEQFSKRDQKISVLCSAEKRFTEHNVLENVNVVRAPRLGVLFSQPITPTWPLLYKQLARDADIIHFHAPNPLAEISCLLFDVKKPIVVTWHADIVRQKFIYPFYKPLLRKFLERVDKIIVPTENHIKYSDILPEFRHKCEIIPFGSNPELLRINSDRAETKVQEMQKTFGPYFLFVGRLVSYKGVDVLIKAMRNVNANLIIVGEGPLKTELGYLVEEMGIKHKVNFFGRVEDFDTFKGLYHGCEAFVLPSVTAAENFGIVQLEAMSCGKPVIATDIRSGVPVVGKKDETSLIVPPNDPESLAKAMTRIVSNQELKQRLGENGEKRFKELYTLDTMIDDHLSLYLKLLGLSDSKKEAA